MAERLFIITGASRGLGAAMADRLAAPGHVLLCIARHNDPAFAAHGASKGARVEQWDVDLGRPGEVSTRLASWLGGIDARESGDATLINNAAVLTPVGPLDACTDAEISQALRVGLEAPMLLTAAFLRATREWA
ncbi:MAG: SDR family NAD(P)-dependent oxidoreductase, partial [Caldimonas sp.]